MRTATGAVEWARNKEGDVGWHRRCLVFVRSAWDLPAQDGSAQLEWNSIPAAARHVDRRPSLGAPCFWRGPTAEGHVAIVVEYRNNVPHVASNDIGKPDRIDIVPLSRIAEKWSGARWLGWTTILQGRSLPLGRQPVDGPALHVGFRQNGKVFSSKMRFGQRDSDSVWNLQRALLLRGYKLGVPTPTGNYLDATKAAVAKFQRDQHWTGADADGIAGRQTITRLGLTWVVG